jgi:hypothetical protein
MAGCDHKCRFRWADIRHPGLTSDYLAFATSDLGLKLEHDNNDIMKPGYTMVGDNAWVPRPWMATPISGHCVSGTDDAYNFYHSQVRITIERAFGILVHRWGILRRPLSVSMLKVPPLVICLMKLHNYCINSKTMSTPCTLSHDERCINRMASTRGSTVWRQTTPLQYGWIVGESLWSSLVVATIFVTCLVRDGPLWQRRIIFPWKTWGGKLQSRV